MYSMFPQLFQEKDNKSNSILHQYLSAQWSFTDIPTHIQQLTFLVKKAGLSPRSVNVSGQTPIDLAPTESLKDLLRDLDNEMYYSHSQSQSSPFSQTSDQKQADIQKLITKVRSMSKLNQILKESIPIIPKSNLEYLDA